MKLQMVCVAIKHKLIGIKSISSIIIIKPTLKSSPQSPLSNLFMKVTPKVMICMYNPTLRHGERVVTEVEPIVKVIVKYLEASIKS
jgi:hypothetical protein